jgi:hypothetical protein
VFSVFKHGSRFNAEQYSSDTKEQFTALIKDPSKDSMRRGFPFDPAIGMLVTMSSSFDGAIVSSLVTLTDSLSTD